jgi:choline dehydrogenase
MEAYQQHKAGPLGCPMTAVAFVPYSTLAGPHEDVNAELQAIAVGSVPDRYSEVVEPILLKQLSSPKEASTQFIALPSGNDMSKNSITNGVANHNWPGSYLDIGVGSTRSFSRGYVHIKSADPDVYPEIDPKYMSHPLDLHIAAKGIMEALKLFKTPPLSNYIKTDESGEPVMQPNQWVPKDLEDAKELVRKSTQTMYHPIGTCSMLPREKGGVVDNKLKVYGTKNLRVVDASIFPLHVQGNIMSLVYAVAEKAADIIKDDAKHGK